MKSVDINSELTKLKGKTRSKEDDLIHEANRILAQDLFSEKKILNNLKHYNNSFELIDEDDMQSDLIFKVSEIKKIALDYRLKFIDSKFFNAEIPYEAILKIKHNCLHSWKKSIHNIYLQIVIILNLNKSIKNE